MKAALAVLLAAATIALYIPVRGYSFVVWDDQDYVTSNLHVRGGLAWSTVKWAFTSTDAANWHPLTWLSHALDYQLFALNPAGHHLDSVLIHALNAALLFLLLIWMTKRLGPSLLVAALLAVHPLNVESVAWVAERKNVLSTLFFFLAIAAYAWYAHKPDWRRYLLVAALFAAGLMAKPMVITLPLVLLLLDYWPLERMQSGPPSPSGAARVEFPRLVLEKVPLLILSAASAWMTFKAQRSGMAVRNLYQFPLAIRIQNAIVAYGLYLWKMIWPLRLAPFYPHSATALPWWQWSLSALVLIAITAFVVVLRRKRYLLVGWLWFLGTLVPVIGLVQVGDAAMADRYAYIPLIGIFLMIAWGLDDWADARGWRTVWLVVPTLFVLAALGFATTRQLHCWQNEYTLWAHTVAVPSTNPFAHDALSAALINPDLAATLNHVEGVDTEPKRMDAARQHYEEALKDYRELAQQNPGADLPYLAVTLNELGNLDRLQNRTDDERQHYEEALQYCRELVNRDPDAYLPYLAVTLNDLGVLNGNQGRPADARQNYEEAVKIYRDLVQRSPDGYQPYLAINLNDLGILDGVQHRWDDARQYFERALEIYRQLAAQNPDQYSPNVAGTLNNLGLLDRNQNRIQESRAHYTEAMAIYQKLAQRDPARYTGDIARIEASLEELGKIAPSR
ncbi:MAG: tetratricopeptide repeat protein [Terriglobales bacterium]